MSMGFNNSDEVYTASQITNNEGSKKAMEAQLRVLAAQSMHADSQFQSFLETAIDTIAGSSRNYDGNYSSSTGSINVPAELEDYFDEASRTYDVDKRLILAVARTESNFTPGATSSHGAMGVMQLMPGTARELGVSDAYDPYENIMGGTKLLRMLLEKYKGDRPKALAAYNAGSNKVDEYGGVPPANQKYVDTVMGFYSDGFNTRSKEGYQDSYAADRVSNTNGTLAGNLKNAFSKFPEHSTYDDFLEELSKELKSSTAKPTDADQAYRILLGSAKTAIDRIRYEVRGEMDEEEELEEDLEEDDTDYDPDYEDEAFEDLPTLDRNSIQRYNI